MRGFVHGQVLEGSSALHVRVMPVFGPVRTPLGLQCSCPSLGRSRDVFKKWLRDHRDAKDASECAPYSCWRPESASCSGRSISSWGLASGGRPRTSLSLVRTRTKAVIADSGAWTEAEQAEWIRKQHRKGVGRKKRKQQWHQEKVQEEASAEGQTPLKSSASAASSTSNSMRRSKRRKASQEDHTISSSGKAIGGMEERDSSSSTSENSSSRSRWWLWSYSSDVPQPSWQLREQQQWQHEVISKIAESSSWKEVGELLDQTSSLGGIKRHHVSAAMSRLARLQEQRQQPQHTEPLPLLQQQNRDVHVQPGEQKQCLPQGPVLPRQQQRRPLQQQQTGQLPLLQQGHTNSHVREAAPLGAGVQHERQKQVLPGEQTPQNQLQGQDPSSQQAEQGGVVPLLLQKLQGGLVSEEPAADGVHVLHGQQGLREKHASQQQQQEQYQQQQGEVWAADPRINNAPRRAIDKDFEARWVGNSTAAAALPLLCDREELLDHLVSAAGALWATFNAAQVTRFLWSAAKLKVYIPGEEEQQEGEGEGEGEEVEEGKAEEEAEEEAEQQQVAGGGGVGTCDLEQHQGDWRKDGGVAIQAGAEADEPGPLTRERVLQTLAAAVLRDDSRHAKQREHVPKQHQYQRQWVAKQQDQEPWVMGGQVQQQPLGSQQQGMAKQQEHETQAHSRHSSNSGDGASGSVGDGTSSSSSSSSRGLAVVQLQAHQLITCCWAVAQVCTPPPPADWVSDRLNLLLPSLATSTTASNINTSSSSSSSGNGHVSLEAGSILIMGSSTTGGSSSSSGVRLTTTSSSSNSSSDGGICVAGFVSSHGLSMLLWALAQFGYRPNPHQEEVLVKVTGDYMGQFSCQGLATVAWALTKMRVKLGKGWLEAWGEAMGKQMGGANGYELTIGVWVLVKQGVRPSPEWLLHLLQRVVVLLQQGGRNRSGLGSSSSGSAVRGSRISGMETLELTRLWWCLSKLGFKPPATIAGTLLAAVVQRQQQLSPQGFALVVLAVACLQLKPGGRWLKGMVSGAFDLLPLFTFQEAGALLLGLAKLGHLPSEGWMEGWWWETREQMQQMEVEDAQVGRTRVSWLMLV